jgi:hypothetical protein
VRCTEKQNEETSLHVVHVHGVVVHFDDVSVIFPTAVFLGKVVFEPLLNQSHLMKSFYPKYSTQLKPSHHEISLTHR